MTTTTSEKSRKENWVVNAGKDYNENYDLVQDRMLRVGEDYQLYEDRDTNHHYEDIYNYIVDE